MSSDTGTFSKRKLSKEKARKGWDRYNPGLLKTCIELIPTGESIIDIGAGYGAYVHQLQSKGYAIVGVDGSRDIDKVSEGYVRHYDLTQPVDATYWMFNCADWGICFEVGGHIPREFESVFINNVSLMATESLIITWESPGQPGSKHVNCRTEAYVASEFRARGWRVDDEATHKSRQNIKRRYRSRLLVLRKI
jgi:hypothetical protein